MWASSHAEIVRGLVVRGSVARRSECLALSLFQTAVQTQVNTGLLNSRCTLVFLEFCHVKGGGVRGHAKLQSQDVGQPGGCASRPGEVSWPRQFVIDRMWTMSDFFRYAEQLADKWRAVMAAASSRADANVLVVPDAGRLVKCWSAVRDSRLPAPLPKNG